MQQSLRVGGRARASYKPGFPTLDRTLIPIWYIDHIPFPTTIPIWRLLCQPCHSKVQSLRFLTKTSRKDLRPNLRRARPCSGARPSSGRGPAQKDCAVVQWLLYDLQSANIRAPKDHKNTRILPTMVTGPWKPNVRSLCLCGVIGYGYLSM